jgi:DNA processing protein
LSVTGFNVALVNDETGAEPDRVALIALLKEVSAVGGPRRRWAAWSATAAQVRRCGSALPLWDERHPLTLDGAGEAEAALAQARDLLAGWEAAGIGVVTVLDDRYPLRLKHIDQVPPVLLVKGTLAPAEPAASVVGSRQASARGRQLAAEIAAGLAQRGIAVVSGLAAGVDTAAHANTLAAGGRPLGVLGTGITGVYPEANRDLHEKVAAAGALVSQFWPDCRPRPRTFALRNATMAGLSQASVIVEAGERSGSRVHARHALQHGRPLILTDTVVTNTRWGREMSRQPGVYVAGSAADALQVLDEVCGGRRLGA